MENNTLTRPTTVGFDWDGTLVDSYALINYALRQVCEKYAKKSIEPYRSMFGAKALKEYFPDLFEDKWEEAKQYYYQIVESEHLNKLKVLPNAIDVLALLNEKNIPIFIVSNKRHDLLSAEIQKLDWQRYFFDWRGDGASHKNKPDPAPIYQSLQTIHKMPNKSVWFIGDTVIDIEAAQSANCTSVYINNHMEYEFLKNTPDKTVSSLLDLKKLLSHIL